MSSDSNPFCLPADRRTYRLPATWEEVDERFQRFIPPFPSPQHCQENVDHTLAWVESLTAPAGSILQASDRRNLRRLTDKQIMARRAAFDQNTIIEYIDHYHPGVFSGNVVLYAKTNPGEAPIFPLYERIARFEAHLRRPGAPDVLTRCPKADSVGECSGRDKTWPCFVAVGWLKLLGAWYALVRVQLSTNFFLLTWFPVSR